MNKIQSPLTKTERVIKRFTLDISKIEARYLKEYGINVNAYFKNISEVNVYECIESKLRFYYPFSVVSDGAFYEKLVTNHKNYYNVWRWEHKVALDKIKPLDNVLEIGCGKGDFLSRIKSKTVYLTGLDLNPAASAEGKERGLKILNDTIFQHALVNPNTYDVVCAFQLFEHVNDVREFLSATIVCLKKGGTLIIGVPNNDSYFFKNDPYHTLNLPPHHMLLWNRESLSYIAQIFDLEILDLKLEPVNRVHKGMMYNLWLSKNLNRIVAKLIYSVTRIFVKRLGVFQNDGVIALAVYRKK